MSEAGAAAEPIAIERSVVEGPPTAALLGAVTEDDLLVVGSRGRGGLAGLLLGSVSEQVAQPRLVCRYRALKRAFDLYREGWTIPKVVGTIRVFSAPGSPPRPCGS